MNDYYDNVQFKHALLFSFGVNIITNASEKIICN